MEARQIGVPKLPAGEPGAISRVWSRVFQLALALWVRRLERQLGQFISAATQQQLLHSQQRSVWGQAFPNTKRTLCGAFCP